MNDTWAISQTKDFIEASTLAPLLSDVMVISRQVLLGKMSKGSVHFMVVLRGMSNNLRPSATLRHQWQATLIVCLKNIYREWASGNQNIIHLMNFWWHFEKLYGRWYLGRLAPPQLHEILDPPVKYPSYVFYVCVVGCSRSVGLICGSTYYWQKTSAFTINMYWPQVFPYIAVSTCSLCIACQNDKQ